MSDADQGPFEQFLASQDEGVWERTLARLLPEIHEVDRNATRIWFSFWPSKLTAELRGSDDPLQTAQQFLLYGEYELQKQLDSSVVYLYGARHWAEVRRAVASYAAPSDLRAQDLSAHIREVTATVSAETGLASDALLGVTAVGFRALSQLGLAAFEQAASSAPGDGRSPEQVCTDRRRESGNGLFGFLRTVDRRHRVQWDESAPGRHFEAVHGQDITMAGAAAGDYSSLDPRRVEGPVPIQCRNGACGFCWVGVLAGRQNLSEITSFERRRLEVFGYVDPEVPEEPHPPIRLSCQARVFGDVTLAIPPWNGYLNGRR